MLGGNGGEMDGRCQDYVSTAYLSSYLTKIVLVRLMLAGPIVLLSLGGAEEGSRSRWLAQ